MNIGKEYASFLNQFEWNYFITCRTPYSIYTMTVRNWITKLLQKTSKVEQVFKGGCIKCYNNMFFKIVSSIIDVHSIKIEFSPKLLYFNSNDFKV